MYHNNLKQRMEELGLTSKLLAKLLNVAPTTLERKINGESEFRAEEIRRLSRFLASITGISTGEIVNNVFFLEG